MPLTKQEIEATVRRLAPFHHDVELPYGLSTQPPDLSRREGELMRVHDVMVQAWPAMLEMCGGSLAGRRVLDVGANCGGFTLQAVRDGAEQALGIDVADHYIEQAQFLKEALEVDEVEFRKMAIDELEPELVGSFDVSLCLGVLYHLENPVLEMRKLAAVTRRLMVVDSQLDTRRPNAPYWRMNIAGATGRDPKGASTSLWRSEQPACQFLPTSAAVKMLLEFLGFPTVVQLEPTDELSERYLTGRRATFIATRSSEEYGSD